MDVEKFFLKHTVTAIVTALVLSIVLQSIFLFIVRENPSHFFNNSFVPLWTHDAGLYGYYAKELLAGTKYPFVAEYMPGFLLFAIAKILPFSLDTLLFYTPVVFSAFIIIPIYLTFKLFDLSRVGFFGGVLGTLAYGYYYRSFFGYYDSDILNLFFPLFAIYGLVGLAKNGNRFFGLLSAVSLVGFSLWYHSYEAISLSIIAVWTLYVFAFKREGLIPYLTILMMAISLVHGDMLMKLGGITMLFWLSFIPIKIEAKYLITLFVILLIGGLLFLDIGQLYERALEYIDKGVFVKSLLSFKFFDALGTVGEASKISLSVWGERSVANTPLAFLGVFGYILLVFRNKEFLLFAPLVGIGFLSMIAGERFVMYGAPILSVGIVYLAYELADALPKYKDLILLALVVVVSIFFLERIIHLAKIETPVFKKGELEVLSKLPKNKRNFILTWWDYGWPLWYETDAKTLIDNGKHFEDNYIVSKLLFTQNQQVVANVSKQSVRFFDEARSKGSPKLMPYLLKKYNPDAAARELAKPSKATRPIYWYLNTSLLPIARVIKRFSDIDIKTGKKLFGGIITYFHKTKSMQFDKQRGILQISKQRFNIQSYTNTHTNEFKQYGGIDIQFIETKDNYLVCTANIYNSFLIQALILRNIDTNVFEIIAQNENSLLLRVK